MAWENGRDPQAEQALHGGQIVGPVGQKRIPFAALEIAHRVSGDQKAALEALRMAQPEIVRGANKGILHANTASRKVSRMHHRISTMIA